MYIHTHLKQNKLTYYLPSIPVQYVHFYLDIRAVVISGFHFTVITKITVKILSCLLYNF